MPAILSPAPRSVNAVEVSTEGEFAVGLHILNIVTGRDRILVVGCFPAAELAWSPYGGRLAYICGHRIHVLTLRGSSDRAVQTSSDAFWPSWSRSGTRIAYSTQLEPTEKSRIYTVALDGSHRRLVARGGAAPAWSPRGRTIAYQTTCGIRLVTPSGRDSTPTATSNACGAIGLPGPPVWSPDGTKLAVEASRRHGIYVMDKNGGALHWVSLGLRETRTWYRALPGRPSWRPIH
jgi:Tol biopolymer transport system component